MTSPTIMRENKFKNTKIRFEPCCKEALKNLKKNIKVGKVCDSTIVIGQFVLLFSSNIIDFSYNFTAQDWDLFAKNIGKCAFLAKTGSINICKQEQFNHSTHWGGTGINRSLYTFWKQMEKVIKA